MSIRHPENAVPVDVRSKSTANSLPLREAIPSRGPGGFVVVHPRHCASFASQGLHRAEDFLALPGEVVSGHPDRHVMQVKLPGVNAYLKRQHFVKFRERVRNALARFGFVSKSIREGMILRRLEELRIDGPEWLAYGESADGRAFLLVADLSPFVELRAWLADPESTPGDRRECAANVGRHLAELHAAGIHHPETTAKHCYVHPATLAVRFLDWQNATLQAAVSPQQVTRSLASFHASLAENLAGAKERLCVLASYRAALGTVPNIAAIERAAMRQRRRRSIRDQRLPRGASVRQPLVWLAGEAVCVVPEMAPLWPRPADGLPFYDPDQPVGSVVEEVLTLPDGRKCRLVRRRMFAPVSRLTESIRCRSWRSPELEASRVLFHLERHEVPAPQLLAFGQKLRGRTRADSFFLFEPPANGVSLDLWITSMKGPTRRARVLETTGMLIRQLHAAGCRIRSDCDPASLILVTKNDPLTPVAIGDPRAIQLCRSLSRRDAERDLQRLLEGPLGFLDPDSRQRLLAGYRGEERDDS